MQFSSSRYTITDARSSRYITTGLENDDDYFSVSDIIYSSEVGPLAFPTNPVPGKYLLLFCIQLSYTERHQHIMILQVLLAFATLGLAVDYPVVSLFIPNADPQPLLGEVLAAVRINRIDPRISN
jgi:hypothetical protein